MKTKFLSLCLALICAIHVLAYDCLVDGIYYNLNNTNKTAEVTYQTVVDNNPQSNYSGTIIIPSFITYNSQTYSVKTIGSFAFWDCSGLTSVTIPNSVTTIGDLAFSDCSGLTSVTIPNSVTTIGDYAFYGCSKLTSVTIPNSVTTIGNYAFCDCSGLTSITIPNSVITIGEQAFVHCSGLTAITIGNSVTTIGENAFRWCRGLTSVTIGNSVTTIGNEAFWNCSGLTSIACEATTPPTCGSLCFEYVDHSIPLYVPAASIEAYKTANLWKDFTNIQAPTNVITYTATSQLSGYDGSLSVGQTTFGPAITSHTFSNGKGTIVCAGEITTIGYRAFYYCDGLTSVTIPNSVTTIGDDAFYRCKGLTSVTIPNSVTSIGESVFAHCSGLTSVAIGNSVTTIGDHAFQQCTGLTSVTIPNSVTTIRDYAFSECSGLTSVTIPNSVTTIGKNAFWGCTNLTSINVDAVNTHYTSIDGVLFNYTKDTLIQYPVGNTRTSYTIPNSVTTIGELAFYECSGLTSVTIGNFVTTIGKYAFSDCSGLTSVTIPNSVTTIGSQAFSDCSGLTSINVDAANTHYASIDGVLFNYAKDTLIQYPIGNTRTSYTIPNFVTAIGDYAFRDCNGLTSLTIPNSVTSIGEWAFYDCSGLTSVTIPNSVTTIGDYAFYKCSDLTSVTIGNSVTTIGDYAFYYCNGLTSVTIGNFVTTIGKYAFSDCSGLTSITIPNSVTTIGDYAFYECSGLTSVTIGNSVTTIGDRAFYGCSGLTSVTIPNSVTTIGKNAFFWCDGLTSVTIGNSVKTIGEGAFYYCDGLTSITCYAITPPTCDSYCFEWVPKSIPVYVPAQSVAAYKQAVGWKEFSNIQEAFMIITCIANNGTITGGEKKRNGDTCTLTVTSNDGYHFTQWSDGNTDNPRSFVVSQDTTFTAEFAKNIYTIDVQTADSVMGSVIGAGLYEYQTNVDITAIPNYGYHFTKWSDGNTDNPRTVSVTGDKTYTAQFDKDQYVVTISKDEHIQSVIGAGTYEYLDKVTLSVTVETYYRFDHWSDGNTDNPRALIVTQDTSFTAISTKITEGPCGDDLTWNYSDGVLVISGTGTMYDYTQGTAPWMPLFRDSISSLVINNGCTSIGNFAFYGLPNKNLKTVDLPNGIEQIGQYAFANCEYLKNLYLGLSLEKIAANAFANDERLLYITCYAIEPPLLDESAFANYDVYLKVPCEVVDEYKVAKGWKLFNKENVSCLSAEGKTVTGDDVIVTPSATTAEFVWPSNDQADSYSLEITKDGIVFCTLTFNATGQLTGIAFAPGRGHTAMAHAATSTNAGWQFTVTGLNQASKYAYTMDVKNASQKSIKTYTGEFVTDGYTDLLPLPYDGKDGIGSVKFIQNGRLLIERNGILYNAHGARVK